MKSTLHFFLVQYLTYFTLIGVSHATPLIGIRVRNAKSREFPNVVSIGKKPRCKRSIENYQYCTGTLISSRHVLTAGHCLFGLNETNVVVIAGDADLYHGRQYAIKTWITFDQWQFGPEFVYEHSYNDLAIITLRKPVTYIEPAPVQKFVAPDLYKTKLRIAGWGTSEDGKVPNVLKTAVVRALSNDQCDEVLELMTNEASHTPVDYFCTRAKPYVLSTCGDSGAPLFNKQNQLVAINLGACPPQSQLCHYSREWVCENQVNLNLHLHSYRHFILCLTINDLEECKLRNRMKSLLK